MASEFGKKGVGREEFFTNIEALYVGGFRNELCKDHFAPVW
jgi:hypothetical protein